ncbi:peptidoglycan DD-metalloendopeptidase family protein [Hephaestia mangrovi]|uniref:peptidoglycan DD-metalloendopeptidase family protein n=1 Tax=Hephaestia mangrovi TaxID=2873268 RepID=UPI003F70DF6A
MRAPLALLGLAMLLGGCIPQVAPPPDYYRSANNPAPAPSRAGEEQVSALPASQPAWEAHPATPTGRFVPASTYTVRPGDTLRRIADRTGAGILAIARANGLSQPYAVTPGEQLTIPGGRYHLIVRGDTGIAIAQAYGVHWSDIIDANGLSEPYLLRAGWRLLIPGGGTPPPLPSGSTAAQRAAAFHLDIGDLVTGSEPALAGNARPAAPSSTSRRVLASTTPIETPSKLIGGFSWPVHGRVVTGFGPGKSGVRSDGIQIAVPEGTPVLAAADGVVAYVGSSIPSLGGLVIVKHGDGYTTVYGNAKELLVRRGQSVKRGQEIAVSGETGAVDQPSVHFEIRKGRDPVDPLGKLSG